MAMPRGMRSMVHLGLTGYEIHTNQLKNLLHLHQSHHISDQTRIQLSTREIVVPGIGNARIVVDPLLDLKDSCLNLHTADLIHAFQAVQPRHP